MATGVECERDTKRMRHGRRGVKGVSMFQDLKEKGDFIYGLWYTDWVPGMWVGTIVVPESDPFSYRVYKWVPEPDPPDPFINQD